MKFTSILKSVILEQSRFELLFDALTKPSTNKEGKKVKPKLSKKEFVELVTADPTTRLNNVDMETADTKELAKVKAGKYVQWLIKNYLTVSTERQPGDSGYERELGNMKALFIEDLYKVTDDLQKYEKFKGRLPEDMRDINKLTPDTLYDAVKDFSLEKTKASKEEKKEASQTFQHPGGNVKFRGPNWTVVEIKDQGQLGQDAACFYGGNQLSPSKGETRWCTSAPGLSNYFNGYIKQGPLYVVIPNNYKGKLGEKSGLPAERYQFHFPSDQFMDVDDRRVNLIELLNGSMAELKDFFKPEFAKGLTTSSGANLEIDSFSHGSVGKYIGLYGLDDLFDTLSNDPETVGKLKHFQIMNRDKNGIIVNIPESIGKFKSLQAILLDNCIDSIPDSVCTLPKLKFLSLMNNEKLREIPECLVDMPELYFLNLRGSNNVVIPDLIKERGNDLGGGMWDLEPDTDNN
jgi:hypothetical protein